MLMQEYMEVYNWFDFILQTMNEADTFFFTSF